MEGSHNKCNRCGGWHQRLFLTYDNLSEAEQYLCRECVGELAIEACPEWLINSITTKIMERTAKSLTGAKGANHG